MRSDLRQCLEDDDVASGIRQILKQLGKTLKHKEKEEINDALSSAQVSVDSTLAAALH